ncbi:MAG: DUF3426 domain-containing protein [Gammaproteobacteria bacterium]
MYTRCTECETLFRVTREQLNAARGQVRCGRCGNVFDALSSLHEEIAFPEESRPDFVGAAPLRPDEEIDDANVNAAPLPDEDDEDAVIESTWSEAPKPFLLVDTTPRRRWPWLLLAFIAVLALAAQLVHLNRAALVEDSEFGAYITKTYDALGIPLGIAARYDLDAFALLHHELTTHPRRDGALHLSGVLSNDATFAQPWPVLELRLEDRFGDVVAARRLRPSEYLRNPPSLNERMPAHARRAIEVELVDPGHDAVGFSINFCAEVDSALRCGMASSPSD